MCALSEQKNLICKELLIFGRQNLVFCAIVLKCFSKFALRLVCFALGESSFIYSGLLSRGPLFPSRICNERQSEEIPNRKTVVFLHFIPERTLIINASKATPSFSTTGDFCVCSCIVNVQRHSRCENLHLPTCIFPCACPNRVKTVWSSFNSFTIGSLRLNSAQLKLSLVEVTSVTIIDRGSVSPPRRSLAHSQWQC